MIPSIPLIPPEQRTIVYNSYQMTSAIYSSPVLYRWAMKLRFRNYYVPRLEKVAAEIPRGARVIDLCCGDCAIYRRFLMKNDVDYLGIDISVDMVQKVAKEGIVIEARDVRIYVPPKSDVIICLGALLHFPAEAEAVIERAKNAARKVIVLEPVKYASWFHLQPVMMLASRFCDFGEGPVRFRYSEDALVDLWRELNVSKIERVGSEIMGIWEL